MLMLSFVLAHINHYTRSISIFVRNSEVLASENLKNIEEMFPQYLIQNDVCNRFKSSTIIYLFYCFEYVVGPRNAPLLTHWNCGLNTECLPCLPAC